MPSCSFLDFSDGARAGGGPGLGTRLGVWRLMQLRGVVVGGACCEVSLSYDCYEGSSMAELLLSRAASSPRIAHHLFWSARRSRRAAFVGVCGISVRGIPVAIATSGQATPQAAFGHELEVWAGQKRQTDTHRILQECDRARDRNSRLIM